MGEQLNNQELSDVWEKLSHFDEKQVIKKRKTEQTKIIPIVMLKNVQYHPKRWLGTYSLNKCTTVYHVKYTIRTQKEANGNF